MERCSEKLIAYTCTYSQNTSAPSNSSEVWWIRLWSHYLKGGSSISMEVNVMDQCCIVQHKLKQLRQMLWMSNQESDGHAKFKTWYQKHRKTMQHSGQSTELLPQNLWVWFPNMADIISILAELFDSQSQEFSLTWSPQNDLAWDLAWTVLAWNVLAWTVLAWTVSAWKVSSPMKMSLEGKQLARKSLLLWERWR